jgi:hypothetical protein
MQRLTRGLVWFGAMLVIGACSGDPTNNKGTPTDIVAIPTAMFVTQGQSKAVIVSAVDEDGQSLVADFSVSNVGPGITAAVDPDFLPVVGSKPIERQGRIVVTGVAVSSDSFRVNALGLTKSIRVTTVAPPP